MSVAKTLGLSAGAGSPTFEVEENRQRASILLVDDQPARLLTYEAMLSGLGLNCVRALSGAEALQKLLAQEFAVIVLDVDMPQMDGFEVARLVREHPRMERTPIIFVTGVNVSDFDRLKGYEVGAIDYIAVPVVPEILRSKVALLVELHDRRRELKALNRSLTDARSRLAAEHAAEIAHKEAQLRAVFEHPDQINVIVQAERDAKGVIKDWIYVDVNATAQAFLGLAREKILGRRISEVFASRASAAIAICTEVFETRQPARYENRYGNVDLRVAVYPASGDLVISSAVDITESKRAEAAARESQDRLVLADRRKDEFLAMLAHELRNPVAPIRTAAEALLRLTQGDQSQSLIAMIQRQGAHLARILDDLLDVARITQGRIELRREVTSVTRCIDLAIEGVQQQILAKRHRLTMTRESAPLHVSADRVRLEQCVTNLLANAVKYTDEGGEIRIRTYADAMHACIEVADSGIGIAADFVPRVFELFAQSDRPLDRSQGGLGIGLSICKQLVEMHGGTIACESEGLGRGATFTIRLPLLKDANESQVQTSSSVSTLERILIVDDNRDAADSLALCFQLEGYETLAVYSSEHALSRFASYAPDIVLLDIGLPLMNGYEVARKLRAVSSSLRLIALTGYGQDEDKQRTAAAGFDAHLTKPVDLAALKQAFAPTRK